MGTSDVIVMKAMTAPLRLNQQNRLFPCGGGGERLEDPPYHDFVPPSIIALSPLKNSGKQ